MHPHASSDAALARLFDAFPLVNDHPDVAGVLRDPELLASTGRLLAEPYRESGVTVVLAPEARGPILGGLVAVQLGAGLVLARKDQRNHPGADIPVESAPTWRGSSEVFLGRSFDLNRRDRVLIVDDWITTGSTMRAARNIIQLLGATFVGAAVLVNKSTPETLEDLAVHWLVDFDQLMSRD